MGSIFYLVTKERVSYRECLLQRRGSVRGSDDKWIKFVVGCRGEGQLKKRGSDDKWIGIVIRYRGEGRLKRRGSDDKWI